MWGCLCQDMRNTLRIDMKGPYNMTGDPQCCHVSADGVRCTKPRARNPKLNRYRSPYCDMHYSRMRRGTPMDAPEQKQDLSGQPQCCHVFENGTRCREPRARRKGRNGQLYYRSRYCNMHASRLYEHLDMEQPKYMKGHRDSLIYG